MANSHPLVSVISAGLTKRLALILALIFLAPVFLLSQEKEDPLSAGQRRKFNEIFFLAEKEKNLGNDEKALEHYNELYKIDENNATVAFELAQLHAQKNEGEEAIKYGEKAVVLQPQNKWFQILLSSIYGKFNKVEKQIETLQRLAKLDSTNPDYRYELAMVYQGNNQPKKAIAELNDLEAIMGINEIISDQKKTIYLQQNDLQGAVEEIQKLIDAYPKNLDFYGTIAQLYMVNGMEEKALKVYDKMMETDSTDPRPHLDLAQYYQQQKNFDKSIFHLKKAMESPELEVDKKVAVLLSLFEASANDSILRNETYSMLDVLLEQNPNDPKAFAIYGDFLSRDGKDKEALGMYKKAVKLDGGALYEIWNQILLIETQGEMYDSLAVDGPMAVELFPNQPLPYLFSGIALGMVDRQEDALDYLESGLLYVLGNQRLKEQFYTQLANLYNEMGEYPQSDIYFDKALVLNNSNPTVLNNYAYYLSVRGENLEKALEMTKRCNTLAPGNPTFMDTWAWVLYKKGDYQKALEVMEKTITLGGDKFGEVVEHYGDILYKSGQTSQAVEKWKSAKELGGTSENIDQKIRESKIVE